MSILAPLEGMYCASCTMYTLKRSEMLYGDSELPRVQLLLFAQVCCLYCTEEVKQYWCLLGCRLDTGKLFLDALSVHVMLPDNSLAKILLPNCCTSLCILNWLHDTVLHTARSCTGSISVVFAVLQGCKRTDGQDLCP